MTMTAINRPVLVLNKSWTPLSTTPMKRALKLVIKGRAKIIDPLDFQALSWEDWSMMRPEGQETTFRAMGMNFRLPEVIVLLDYDRLPNPKSAFSRRELFKRDHHTCQYCGRQPGLSELTVEHVIPRSRGGTTTWENCVACCVECNSKKANTSLKESGMKLRCVPAKPKIISRFSSSVRIDSWSAFVSEAYWTTPLSD